MEEKEIRKCEGRSKEKKVRKKMGEEGVNKCERYHADVKRGREGV